MKRKGKLLPLSFGAIVGIAMLTGCGGPNEVATYTYHDVTSGNPEQWAPATWHTTEDSVVPGYCEMGLVDYVLNDAGNGYEVVAEMAEEIPTDVTSTLTAEEVQKYGANTKADGSVYTSGQKWQVKLNKNAKFEDGTVINADTYVESLKDLLDPDMQNYRSGDYAAGSSAIAGASSYLKSGRTLLESYWDGDGVAHSGTATKEGWYFNAYDTNDWWAGMSFANLCEYIGSDETYALSQTLLKDTDTFGTAASPKDVRLDTNSDLLEKIATCCEAILKDAFSISSFDHSIKEGSLEEIEDYNMASWCKRYYTYGTYSFDGVGIQKIDEYTFNIIFLSPLSDFNAKQFFSSNWIVKQSLWDSLRTPIADSDLYTTTYGTSKETYVAYGPYVLSSFQKDKEYDFTKNPSWYGYSDGKHNNEFQIDKIEVKYVASSDTMLSLFRTGEVDGYSLRGQDLDIFGSSSRLMYTPQSYTTKCSLNSDFNLLKANQEKDNNGNRTILSNKKFRQALSLGLDRKTFCQTKTAGWRAFDVPINFMYVSDPETGVAYRDTEQGKRAVTQNFGTDSDGQPNYIGYDLAEARKLINEAVDEEMASTREGHYDGGKVYFTWELYNEDWKDYTNWIVDNYMTLFKGTKLEGKVTIDQKIGGSDYSNHIKAGTIEMGISTWGGAQFDPFGILECYTYSANRYEPYAMESDKLEINVKTGEWSTEKGKVAGEAADIEYMPLGDNKAGSWTYELNTGKYGSALADANTRLNILSACESYMVGTYNWVTWGARQSVSLNSYRVQTGTNDYVQIVGFGGIRKMKLTKSDSEWKSWVSQNLVNGFIDYNK